MLLKELLRVEPEPCHHTRTEVLHHDVCLGDYAFDESKIVWILEVKRNGFLTEVCKPVVFGCLVGGKWPHLPGVIAGTGPLDFDDAGTGVGQHPGAGRAGKHAGEIYDGNALKCVRLGWVEVRVSGYRGAFLSLLGRNRGLRVEVLKVTALGTCRWVNDAVDQRGF